MRVKWDDWFPPWYCKLVEIQFDIPWHSFYKVVNHSSTLITVLVSLYNGVIRVQLKDIV